jgi:hypothetical protein
LSTAAIVGGVAVAGVAAAAASSGGGGGSSSPPPATQGHPFAGTWTGTATSTESFTCSGGGFPSSTTCNSTQPFTVVIDPNGIATLTLATGTDVCNGVTETFPGGVLTGIAVSNTGTATVIPPVEAGGTVDVCQPVTVTFSLSPRRISGTGTCTVQSNTPGVTCNGSSVTTITGG